MASVVAKSGGASSGSSSQISSLMSIQEKGSRNKRKFRADPPLVDPNKIISSPQNECLNYEFSAEKFEITPGHDLVQPSACDLCSVNQDHPDVLRLNLGLPSAIGSSEVECNQPREEIEVDEFQDADWSDLTETQLEELVLCNLDTIFKSAIKKIVASGYSEEVVMKAILRSARCYGCKDTVSNIVDSTLAFLKKGQKTDPSREHCFEDLQQLEKYILAELVCVLREVRPFFSTGDAMWCLLICDMNVSHACAMDGDPLSGFINAVASEGNSSTCNDTKTEAKTSELSLPTPCKPNASSIPSAHISQSEMPTISGLPNLAKPKNFSSPSVPNSEKENSISLSTSLDNKSFNVAGTSHSLIPEEKFVGSRKAHSGNTKKDSVLRQKSVHLEKSYRHGSKVSSRTGKLNGFGSLILDKKLKSVSDSTSINLKTSSLKISKAMGVDVPQDSGNHSPLLNLDTINSISTLPKNNVQHTIPSLNTPPALSDTDTELSLSLSTTINSASNPLHPSSSYDMLPYDKSLDKGVPHDKKDEMILKLVPRVRELQNQLQEWTEWANQKVMQAARRLSKDKAELKTLRQEKEEVERLKKDKQSLEENTMKKLAEMENALAKASGQVERANTAVKRLEIENSVLRQEMEAAKLRAAESAASCQEMSKREKKTMMKFQTWERQKTLLQEELLIEKRKLVQLQQELEQASDLHNQLEGRWKQEEKAKEELLMLANSARKEREQIEISSKSKEDMMKLKAESNIQKYKDDIQKLEREISQLRLKTDSSKIAALRSGINGSYASRVTDTRNTPAIVKESQMSPYVMKMVTDVKRERECVMCLSEEMSVVFLPCAHQVVCATCNELHEKQGMKDCPSCRCPIHRRIPVRFRSSEKKRI